ncbi:MAG: hypothetical protein HGA31_05495 [Candidatus Moranbacteria bacterium]|nr:hypothetical protein [Candidatus Moranbacteria bacterium]
MNSQNTSAKRLGDSSLVTGDKVRLDVIWTSSGPAFGNGLSLTNRVGDFLPLCFVAAVEGEPGLTIGDAYLADVTGIEHLLDVADIDGIDYGIVAVTVGNLVRHEEWTEIGLTRSRLVRKLMCGNNLIDEEVIPVTVNNQMYRYDYVPEGLLNIREIRIGDIIVFQMPALEPAVRGTMSNVLVGFLPKMSLQEYEKLNGFAYDWETMQRFAASQPVRLSAAAC